MNDDTLGNWKTMGGSGDEEARGAREAWTLSDAVTEGENGRIVLAGRYRVVKRLGEGGMGSVWLAEDTKLDGRKVAVKMLPTILVGKKGAYKQVKAEAMVAMKLSHPNIATVRAFEEDEGGNPFLVMDYIDGEGLDDILAEKGALGEEETLRILGPVAAALDYAHERGVVHRDVKPGNVMLAKDGTPFVLDFGIAREIQETMTRVTGKLSSGTLLYMSPEQLRGKGPNASQDVYSFSAMAYECLAGHPPFFRGAIEDQIKNEAPEELPGSVGEALREGVMAGLAKEPGARPGSCAGVLGRDEAEKREREKRAAEEAERLRQEVLLRERERARAEAEQRQREEALEAERQARALAEAKAEKARREAERQAAAVRRERAARSAEASKGKGWMVLAVALAVAAAAGGWAWWQTEQGNRTAEKRLRVLETEWQEAQREADEAKKKAAAIEQAVRENADKESATLKEQLEAALRKAGEAQSKAEAAEKAVAEQVAKAKAEEKATAEKAAREKAAANAARGEWDGALPGDARKVSLPKGAKMTLKWCPEGSFTMGSPATEEGRDNDETQHEVTLTRGFWMAETEVTQGQWKALMNGETVADLARKALQDDTGYDFNDGKGAITMRERWGKQRGDDPMNRCGDLDDAVPVYNVSWGEAKEFCRRLTEKGHNEGWLPTGYRFRLPTEAEWEYACRAGTKTALPNGQDIRILGENNAPALDDIAWYGGNSSVGFEGRGWNTDTWPDKQYPGGLACARKVGLKAANDWGLYDMIGNVWAWCEDEYAGYPAESVTNYCKSNGSTALGVRRVLRGGSWGNSARVCRSANRGWYPAGYRYYYVGFRPVCSARTVQ